jgi:hypothetical protein
MDLQRHLKSAVKRLDAPVRTSATEALARIEEKIEISEAAFQEVLGDSRVEPLLRADLAPRGILTPALLMNPAAEAVAHNHPSGDATQTWEDEMFMQRVVEAGKMLGVEVVGSVIVGGRGLWRGVRS